MMDLSNYGLLLHLKNFFELSNEPVKAFLDYLMTKSGISFLFHPYSENTLPSSYVLLLVIFYGNY